MERLQKVIANSGYCSRRKAEELILNGHVFVDGVRVTELGVKVNGNSAIQIDGVTLKTEAKEYILFYKPRSVICSVSDEKNRKTVVDLVKSDKRIYPVGRLDYDTTGVLLLTNDGELSNLLISPKSHVSKTYVAKVSGCFKKDDAKIMATGVEIDGYTTKKCNVKIKRYDKKNNGTFVEVTLYEGKNHQVKKKFEALGFMVIKLKREMFAFLTLDGLSSGQYRYLTIKEVHKLYSLVQQKKS